jgi:hypothetical protein
MTGGKPSLKNIKVFGCGAYVLILPTPSKFERRDEPGVLLECLSYGVYKVLVPLKDGGESKIMVSRHVTLTRKNYLVLRIWRILWMATALVIQATRASQSKVQAPVMKVCTPTVGQNLLMLLRSILHIRNILVIAALKN